MSCNRYVCRHVRHVCTAQYGHVVGTRDERLNDSKQTAQAEAISLSADASPLNHFVCSGASRCVWSDTTHTRRWFGSEAVVTRPKGRCCKPEHSVASAFASQTGVWRRLSNHRGGVAHAMWETTMAPATHAGLGEQTHQIDAVYPGWGYLSVWRTKNGAISHPRLNEGTLPFPNEDFGRMNKR